MMNKSFGTKLEGKNYRERAGAYALPIDEQGRVALVEAPAAMGEECWLFLIGGGLEPGESGEECVRRECLEETGYTIDVGEVLCTGDEYLFAPSDRRYLHMTGTCYGAVLGEKVCEAIEKDHTLRWVPAEACYDKMFLKYQAWAVEMAWRNTLTKLSLRRANMEGASLIWEMQKLAFGDLLQTYQDFDTNPAAEPLEKVELRLSQKERFYYFIDVGKETVGAISVTDKRNGGNKRLSPMFILPQFQGRRYAQEAIKAAEAIHGTDGWELDTILQEKKLRHLYEKMGYMPTEKTIEVNKKMTLIFYQKG